MVVLTFAAKGSAFASLPVLVVLSALIGANYGANLALYPSITKDFYGLKNFGVNYGLVFTAYGVGAVVGGIIAAQIAATTVVAAGATFLDAYRPFFLVVAALAAVGLVVAFMLMKPPVKKTA